jgi:hypothetical protein
MAVKTKVDGSGTVTGAPMDMDGEPLMIVKVACAGVVKSPVAGIVIVPIRDADGLSEAGVMVTPELLVNEFSTLSVPPEIVVGPE